MLMRRKAFVPACLMLGVLLNALPTLADTPAAPPLAASGAQTIALQHITPGDIVKTMRWDLAANLSAGVTQIVAVPLQNALLVTGSSAGLATVRQGVKLLDIEPRQVQIKFVCADLSEADLEASGLDFDLTPPSAPGTKQGVIRFSVGPGAARFLQTLTNKKAVTTEPTITTTDNVEAVLSLSATDPPAISQQISVTPRISADSSITLALSAAFSEGTAKQAVSTLRTVKSGDTLLLVMPPASAGGKNLLLFVTAINK